MKDTWADVYYYQCYMNTNVMWHLLPMQDTRFHLVAQGMFYKHKLMFLIWNMVQFAVQFLKTIWQCTRALPDQVLHHKQGLSMVQEKTFGELRLFLYQE